VGRLGRLPAPALAGPKFPPGPASWEFLFFFLFHFFFPFSYIYLYTDILCTKNSLNKLYDTKIIMYNNWHTPPSHHDWCIVPYQCLLAEEGSDPPEFVAPEEGQELDTSEIDLLYQESFNEGKSILALMHNLPILSTTT
jgi:hypothetical protein